MKTNIISDKRFTDIALLDCSPLHEPALFDAAFSLVDMARKDKISACRSKEDRCLSLGVGLLCRRLLKRSDISSEHLGFDADGRPVLADVPAYLSLSHSGRYAMAGISSSPIGVDVEIHQPESIPIAGHFFMPEEQELLSASNDPTACFFDIWCRKECMIKRDGLQDLRELSTLSPRGDACFYDFPLDGYSCVCYGSRNITPRFYSVPLEDLVNLSGTGPPL
ncbi:MAG: 4'-phosphopantetheinyl transferase superfamily protein [Lachnospiraceae bacterium]|nr:4'-phosphopantetheinyl transferase superfamily protein [Lachnospiraceae bacterium]